MKLFKDKKKTGNLSTQYYEMLMTSQMNSSDRPFKDQKRPFKDQKPVETYLQKKNLSAKKK